MFWYSVTILTSCAFIFIAPALAHSRQIPADSAAAALARADEKALLLILAPEEKSDFQKQHSPEERSRWLRLYWKKRDPTPTTEKNELQEEFQRRLDYARRWYGAMFEEGFDDRGRVYVKYGEPSDKYVQPAGEIHVRPNESWAYPDISKGLVFDFVDRGGHYKLIDDLSQALGTSSDLGKRLDDLARLYENRSHLDASYGAIADELNRNMSTGNFNMVQREFEISASKSQLVRNAAPVATLRYLHRAKPLPVALSLARFQEGDSSRVEIYYGVPFNHLRFEPANGRWLAKLAGEIAIFNQAYELVAGDSVRTVCNAPTEAAKISGAFISQFNFTLHPGQYQLVLHLKNAAGADSAVAILRSDFIAPNFGGKALHISDLQLSPNIRFAARAGTTRFVKNGLEIMPLPGLAIQKQRPLYVYFEIYNLTLRTTSETSYEIEYSVKQGGKAGLLAQIAGASPEKKKSVSLQEKRAGKSSRQFEQIALDLSALLPGKLELTVAVKDIFSGQQATATVPLRLEDGRK